MIYPGKEKKRVFNIIWNASGDYSFQPGFEIYDRSGEASLYWNFIIGAVHKYYNYPLLEEFFNDLRQDPNPVFYTSLTWLGLENCAFEKAKKDRPVLEDLRLSCARQVLRKEDAESYYYLVDEIKTAHFQRALGLEVNAREQVVSILNDLEFPEWMSTEQIIHKMKEIIETYFPLSPASGRKRLLQKILPGRRNRFWGETRFILPGNPFFGFPVSGPFPRGFADFSNEVPFQERESQWSRGRTLWNNFQNRRDKRLRDIIQKYYGASILSISETKALEQILCVENHKDCRLHFTRGEFDTTALTKTSGPGAAADSQREKNRLYYKNNLARNASSIEKLTSMIRTALQVSLEPSSSSACAGRLVAGKVWRNIYLYDSRVFIRNVPDEVGNLTVDILLDASGSQMDRQEIIASQAFIIAESLARCRIPVKIYSFCTNKNFTIFTIFHDYSESKKNDRVFNYHSSGCNRDGLAVRTALHMMKDSPTDYKILIVLTDGKPLDPHGISAGAFNPEQSFYADAAGVKDTAAEIRKGRQNGIYILGVFTGLDEDIPAAKKMYGNDLVCIQSPEKFADIVGVLLRNVLKNL